MKEYSLINEREVLEQIKKGNKEDYRQIVDRYMKRAYYIALGFVHNEEDALDISQEAFIKAYRKIKNFDINGKFFPWFYMIIRNLCFDYIKKRKRLNEVPLNGVRILNTEKEDREMKKILWQGIENLSMEQKEIIVLRYFQDFSYKEIAQILNKPIGSIMSSLYYAKSKLKKELKKYL